MRHDSKARVPAAFRPVRVATMSRARSVRAHSARAQAARAPVALPAARAYSARARMRRGRTPGTMARSTRGRPSTVRVRAAIAAANAHSAPAQMRRGPAATPAAPKVPKTRRRVPTPQDHSAHAQAVLARAAHGPAVLAVASARSRHARSRHARSARGRRVRRIGRSRGSTAPNLRRLDSTKRPTARGRVSRALGQAARVSSRPARAHLDHARESSVPPDPVSGSAEAAMDPVSVRRASPSTRARPGRPTPPREATPPHSRSTTFPTRAPTLSNRPSRPTRQPRPSRPSRPTRQPRPSRLSRDPRPSRTSRQLSSPDLRLPSTVSFSGRNARTSVATPRASCPAAVPTVLPAPASHSGPARRWPLRPKASWVRTRS